MELYQFCYLDDRLYDIFVLVYRELNKLHFLMIGQ